MRMLAAVVLAVIASAAATSTAGAASAPVTRAAWQSVLGEVVAHGRLTGQHSCAAVVVARTHAPPRYKEGSRVVHTLDGFLYTRCRKFGRIHSLRVGMTNSQVVSIAGAPVPWLSGPTCWVYRGRTFDALRVCFLRSRVSSVVFAVHG